MYRHHLIEEAKSELDVAYEEVKRIEQQHLTLANDMGDSVDSMSVAVGDAVVANIDPYIAQKRDLGRNTDLIEQYDVQTAAVGRFELVSKAFSIVATEVNAEQAVARLNSVILRSGDPAERKEIEAAIHNFCDGLFDYMRFMPTFDNDKKIRDSWRQIEDALRAWGRRI